MGHSKPAFFCAKAMQRYGMKAPKKNSENTPIAPFHLFFAKSAPNMKVGLLAWPPPPMPAPEPRAATRRVICASAELLQAASVDNNEAGAAGVVEGAAFLS